MANDPFTAYSQEREAPSARQIAGAGLVAVVGLLLAINAIGPAGIAEGSPTRFIIHLPTWIVASLVVALTGVSLIVLAPLLPEWRRRRKKDDEPHEFYYEPPKLTLGAVAILILVAFAPLCLIASTIWISDGLQSSSSLSGAADSTDASAAGSQTNPSQPPAPVVPRVHSAAANDIIGTIAVVFSVLALAIVLWFRYGDRLSWRTIDPFQEKTRKLSLAIGEALEDLRLEPDIRRAIVACYARFERSLGAAGHGRRPSDTPIETMHRALQQLRLPDNAVTTLTRLFEIARFSRRSVTPADRDAAWQALVFIRARLDKRGPDAPVS